MRLLVVLGVLAGCADAPSTDDTDPPTVDLDCLTVRDEVSGQRDGFVEDTRDLVITSDCTTSARIADVSVEAFTAEFVVGEPDRTELEPGASAGIPITFTTSGPNVREETVLVTFEAQDPLSIPLRVETLGPTLSVELSTSQLVRTCPTPVTASILNAGPGLAALSDLAVTLDGTELAGTLPEQPLATGARHDLPLDLTLSDATAELRISFDEALLGPQSFATPLTTDAMVEREDRFPAWSEGRPLDVLITVDRNRPGYDARDVEDGLRRMLDTLQRERVDYRIAGLIQDTGCPIGAGPIDPSLGAEEGASRLSGMLDLDFNRYGDGLFVDAPFTWTQIALDPALTAESECNGWRRPEASLSLIHVGHRDDRSGGTVDEHLASLRDRVRVADRVAISAIAPPPPDGCDGLAAAERLYEAATDSGGRFVGSCAESVAPGLASLTQVPGAEEVVRLSDVPYAPSLQVRANDRLIEGATLDGTLLTLPRSVDRYRDEVVVRYVTAAACP